jgi:hypothetical protein
MNTEHEFIDTNRHLVEVPDTFAIARWPRDADVDRPLHLGDVEIRTAHR